MAAAVHIAVRTLVEYFAAHEALSRLAFIDIFDVGPGMIGRLTRSVEDFTKLLTTASRRRARPADRPRSRDGRGLVDAGTCIAMTGPRALPALVEELTFIVLAPYVGERRRWRRSRRARPAR